jgi:hypothetical protein
MIPQAREVRLTPEERALLEARCRAPTTPQRDVRRARIVLLAAAGRSTRAIAREVGVRPRVVSTWRNRFADQGLDGLKDKPHPGKKPIYTEPTAASSATSNAWRQAAGAIAIPCTSCRPAGRAAAVTSQVERASR